MIIGIAFLIIGIGAFLQQIGYLPADLNLFWAIMFSAIGLSMLFGKKDSENGCCGGWFKEKKTQL